MLMSKSNTAWDQETYWLFQVNEDIALPFPFVFSLLYCLPKKLEKCNPFLACSLPQPHTSTNSGNLYSVPSWLSSGCVCVLKKIVPFVL